MATNQDLPPAPITESDPNSKPSVCLQDMEEVRKVFRRFDTNGDGKISVSELDSVLQAMGSSVPPEQLSQVLSELDTDKDGVIDLAEFAAFCRSTLQPDESGSSELRDAFDLYDQDRDGFISFSELHLVLNRLGMNCSVEDCQRMIRSVDSDGDGKVNFEEFRKMMTNNANAANGTAP